MTIVIRTFPMRYPASHKQSTRRRIVEAASQAFREHGVAETGVDEVMRRAGLTHGGFYAHFRDKTELIAEACAAAFDAAVPNLERIAAAATPAARARLLIDSYLGPRHRDNRGSGCLVVAVGADMARLQGAARRGYARGFAAHMERVAAALRLSPDPKRNRDRVTQLMSSLVGGLLLARAIDDPAASDAMLHGLRRQLRAEFCGAGDARAGTGDRESAPQDSVLKGSASQGAAHGSESATDGERAAQGREIASKSESAASAPRRAGSDFLRGP